MTQANRYLTLVAALFAVFHGLGPTFSAVNVPSVISDGMVLQRQIKVPIWGWG